METVRIPVFDDEGNATDELLTISTCDITNYTVVADYVTPIEPTVGPYSLRGTLAITNKRSVTNTVSFRGSTYIGDNLVPFIPRDSTVCWDKAKGRISNKWSITLDPNAQDETEITWDIELRNKNMTADINGDGWVDALDQSLILGSWNTTDYRTDLNFDGITNSTDLGIVFVQWSNSTKDD
jgi:hypothetical protein